MTPNLEQNPRKNVRRKHIASLWSLLGLQYVSQHYRVMLAFSSLILILLATFIVLGKAPFIAFVGGIILTSFLYLLARHDANRDTVRRSHRGGRK